MLQVARLAQTLLGDARTPIEGFLREQFHADGGARNRAGDSDLYYTVFALDGLVALQAELPTARVAPYLDSFADGAHLDLVHLACLARCRAAVPEAARPAGTAAHLERFRSADGGFHAEPGSERGTVYDSFLALGTCQDLGVECADARALEDCLAGLRCADGGYANAPGLAAGSTPATAAAVTLLRQIDRPVPGEVGEWLLARAHPGGGFLAGPAAPLPDLLSTSTALHALAGLGVDFSSVREGCLDFVDTLWTGKAFCGHWADEAQDSEYTFYALLALGHLSL